MNRRIARGLAVALAIAGASGCSSPAKPATSAVTASWSITYRTEAPSIPQVRTEVVDVERPYRARTMLYEPDGTTLVSGTIWTEAGLYLVDDGGQVSQVQDLPPGRPGPDVRLEVTLPGAVARGAAEEGEADEVAGVSCTHYRTRGPLDTNLPEAPTAEESTTSCVDEMGRVLEDEWTLDGAVIRRRTAQAVSSGILLDDATLFGTSPVTPVPDGLVLQDIRRLDDIPDEVALGFPFPDVIDDLPLDLLVEVRDRPLPANSPQGMRVLWQATYTDGVRLVVVRQSRTLQGPRPTLPHATPFELPPLQDAVIEPSFDGFTVTGTIGEVDVEITGAIRPEALAALRLTRTPGSTGTQGS